MSNSIIDALVVTLSLDSKGFNDGITKAMGSLTGFATKVAGLAIGFEGLEAGIHYFEDLNRRLADLYFTGRNLGVLGTELSRLGELAKLFGGNMEDAAGSVNTLQSAVFNLRFKGQMSESLAMLQRFGVAYLTASGHMRDPEAIARDAAVTIERQARAAGLTRGERFQLAQSFGLQGGLASAAAAGPANFDAELARARADQGPHRDAHGKVIPGLTEDTLRQSADLSRHVTSRRTERDAEMSQVLKEVIPNLEDFNELLQDLARAAIPKLLDGIQGAKHAFTAVKDAATSAAKALEKIKVSTTLAPVTSGEKPVNFYSPFSYTWRAGEKLSEQMGAAFDHLFSGTPTLPGPPPAHGSITRSHAVIPPRAPVTPLAPRPPSGAGSKPTAANIDNSVQIDHVTINTRATNADALARDLAREVRRKMMVSSSDPGMIS